LSFERVLITGGGGQLGSDLAELLDGRGRVEAPPHAELDVADDEAVAARFEDLRPQVVFNCAAFHNVDVCEREPGPAFEVNSAAVGRLGRRCADAGARLVHLSTNYVFDGDRSEPYAESDQTNPRSVYARSKLAGEGEALAAAPDALVVRTAGLYGLHGSASKGGSFVTRMIGRAREGEGVRMVADQRLTPTFTADLAAALVAAVEGGASGVVHVTNSGATSWFEFTEEIFRLAGIDVPLEAVSTTVPEGGAERPLNGVLAGPAAEAAGIPALRPWQDALGDYMERAGLLTAAA
jgi:dTDP-4-dehydrorhamnose reductase